MSEIAASTLPDFLSARDVLLVVRYGAPWCAPCRRVAAPFEQYSAECTSRGSSVRCASVNVDDLSDAERDDDVKKIPTFVVWFNGRKVGAKQTSDIVEVRGFVKACFDKVAHPSSK